jgi:HK97 family phage major capsid protein
VAYNNIISRSDLGALVPEEVSNVMLDNLAGQTNGSAALRLGTRIPVARNQTRFPVLAALPQAYWVNGDTGLKQTTEAAWANKFMNIEELATIVPIPEAVLEDAGYDVWGAIRPLMEEAIARAFDVAVFFGINAPASFPDDIVTSAVAAGNVVVRGTNAANAGGLYADYSDLLATLEAEGYIASGAIGNVTIRAQERRVRDANGQPIARPADMPDPDFTANVGLWPSGAGAAELIIGQFSKIVVGVRRDMSYKLLTEGVITDNATPPNIIFNLPQQDMIAMRLTFPINFQQQVEADRYPFAVMQAPA